MKRYDLIHYCPYPGGGESALEEAAGGDWVKHEEAQSEIDRLRAENERLKNRLSEEIEWGHRNCVSRRRRIHGLVGFLAFNQ